jgi:hypothetical protein
MSIKYRVWVRTTPGFHAQYDGKVDVWAADEDGAANAALAELRRGAFSDWNNSFWKIERVERVWS